MDSKKRLVPSIRFKEFTNDWEQKKLEKILLNTKSNFEITDALTRGKYEIFGVNGKIGYVNYLKEKFNSKILIIAKDGSVGKIQILPENSTFTSTLEGLKPLRSDKILFIYLQLSRTNLSKFHIGSTIKHLHFKDYKHTKIRVADLIEQNAISDFFENLDQLITLHQRKLSKLENIKKTLLEKMFPAEKQTKPSIRFKEFTNDWEQEKLKNISIFRNGLAYEIYAKNRGKYNLINLNSISINGELKNSNKFTNYAKSTLKKNSLIIILSDVSKGNLIGKSALIPLNDYFVLNQRVGNIEITNNYDSYFLMNFINTRSLYFKSVASGTSQLNISKNDVLNMNIKYSSLNEQNRISLLINNLNFIITLHQRKLKKLENIKKTLLERMFV